MKYVLNYLRSIWQGLGLMFLGFILGQRYHDLSLSFGVMAVLMGVWLVSMILDVYILRGPSEAYQRYLKDKQESEARGHL